MGRIASASRKRKKKNREAPTTRTRQHQQSVKEEMLEMVKGVVKLLAELSLQDEILALLGREKSCRSDVDDLTEIKARCNRCNTSARHNFRRGGSYGRTLLTSLAYVKIRVPRLSCVCGGSVDFQFQLFAPYERIWFDVEERIRQLAGICVSLRDSIDVVSADNKQPLGISTINGLVNEAAALAEVFRNGRLPVIPPVVVLDALWIRVMEDTGQEYTDKKGRHRRRKRVRKVPILVAYGIDPQSGEKRLLDWEKGTGEDQASWQRLLERLEQRGLRAENGLKMFIHDGAAGLEAAFAMVDFGQGVRRQRCVFHKLRNVVGAVKGEEGMSRKERQQRRDEVLKAAANVYRGRDRAEIEARLESFAQAWGDREPEAVNTLRRGFDATLAYLDVLEDVRKTDQEWPVTYLRTTSPLERVNRALRQKFRQAVILHSDRGLAAAIQLVIAHRRLGGTSTVRWIDAIEEALKAA